MKSIRWKIMFLCVAVLLVPVLLLNRYTIRTFDRFASRDLEDHLIDSAFIMGEQYRAMLDADGKLDAAQTTRLAATAETFGREIQARIQMLSAAGRVLTDSSSNATVNADLSALPEVKLALSGAYGARSALTADHKYMFYYVAQPVMRQDRVCGVAYLSRDTNNILKTLNQIISFQRVTTAAAVVVGVILAAILASSITRRLRMLRTAAAVFARGDAPLDVRVRGRDEIAELAQAIRLMATEVQRTNRYNREFISTVMHELKMPITAIKGAAELLEQGAFNKEEARVKFLGNIRFEADRLARMVWELNEMTKLDAEIPHAQKEKVEYGKCVRDIMDRLEPTLDAGHAEIHVTLPEKPVFTRIIPGRIEQVIGNLIDNAVRYTPSDGRIEIQVAPGADGTVITSVRDTGCGIAASNLGKIFDRFFTTEPKDKPKDYGSGLGLAIAKSIVENHQGRIWVESTPGQGATFSFSLPVAT